MEITEFERRRADNLIWNGAQDYSYQPQFRVYDSDGRAELYWNSIIGAVHRHYDYDRLKEFYETFHDLRLQSMYESFFWLMLENAAFAREQAVRPVLFSLRTEYAVHALKHCDPEAQIEDMDQYRTQMILRGHLLHSLGKPDRLPGAADRELLSALEPGAEDDTEVLLQRLETALREYCGYRPKSETDEHENNGFFARLGALFRTHLMPPDPLSPVRRMAFGFGEHVDEYVEIGSTRDHLGASWTRYITQSETGTRDFIRKNFGTPLFDDNHLRQLETSCCTGTHSFAHLYFTRGDYTDELLSPDVTCRIQHSALDQRKYNCRAYEANRTAYTLAIHRLTEHIRNSLLTCMDSQIVKADAGQLCAGRVWRADLLDDDRIFDRELRGDNGNITVDLLLDASNSQTSRQATVSAQGYMIAESLSRCRIPCRAYSFCSLNGYTVMHLLRDYDEPERNEDIFRYFSSGANRDGLAIRLASWLMKENTAEHRLLIVLTDCKPNDALLSQDSTGTSREYCDRFGVLDTAAEVHRARMDGVEIISVFTGEDDDVPSAQRIYGRNFVRIRSLDTFADTVGRLLKTCLHEL